MTIAGIITMLLSIGAVWSLLICCVRRLVREPRAAAPRSQHSSTQHRKSHV